MFDYNLNLKKQAHDFPIFIEKGKEILKQVVGEFNKLNPPSNSICKLVDNDTKLLIKFLGVSILVIIDKLQDKYGSLIIYKSTRWSVEWEDYNVPINADLKFDHLGNVFLENKSIDGIAPTSYYILEYVIKIGQSNK